MSGDNSSFSGCEPKAPTPPGDEAVLGPCRPNCFLFGVVGAEAPTPALTIDERLSRLPGARLSIGRFVEPSPPAPETEASETAAETLSLLRFANAAEVSSSSAAKSDPSSVGGRYPFVAGEEPGRASSQVTVAVLVAVGREEPERAEGT